jgi:hypothetical protein
VKEKKEIKIDKIVNKWKHDRYNSLCEREKDPIEKTLFIENSNYNEIIKILKNYKIYIEELHDHKIIFRDPLKVNECYNLLTQEGLKVWKAGEDNDNCQTQG